MKCVALKSYMFKKPDNYKDIEQSYIIAESRHYEIFYIQYLFNIHHSSSFMFLQIMILRL